jgi:hypothetical protein
MLTRFLLVCFALPAAVVHGSTLVEISDSADRAYSFAQAECKHGKSDFGVVLEDREGSLSFGFRNFWPRLEAMKTGESLALTFTRNAELKLRFVDRDVNRFDFSGAYRSNCTLNFEKTAHGFTIHGECRKLLPAGGDGFSFGFTIPATHAIDCVI